MRLTVFAATLAFLLWGTPAFAGSAPDSDSDGVSDNVDNCSDIANTPQDDTDEDDCGNFCDADYTQTGTVNFNDFGALLAAFGGTDEAKCHTSHPTIPGCTVNFNDFGFVIGSFGLNPGPSGSTAGTTACPSP
jgi:hypothetical protein